MRKKKQNNQQNIDAILKEWPYDPDAISVRMVEGPDGRDVIQMRIEMGLLQLETSGRPDGQRPEGEASYLDVLRLKSKQSGPDYLFNEDECAEADREFVQYYHRRICWLAMREFRKAVRDADHTLGLMDLCREHSPSDDWTYSHEQYRPFVLFHRIQANALAELDADGPEAAVAAVNTGIHSLKQVFEAHGQEVAFDETELADRLTEFRETLREKFEIGQTLDEQLSAAIAAEEYERAAELRDAIAARKGQV